jgi:hypothetical protein
MVVGAPSSYLTPRASTLAVAALESCPGFSSNLAVDQLTGFVYLSIGALKHALVVVLRQLRQQGAPKSRKLSLNALFPVFAHLLYRSRRPAAVDASYIAR